MTDVVLTDRTDCLNEFGTIAYYTDPCCNFLLTVCSSSFFPFSLVLIILQLVSCCVPYDYNSTVFPYGTEADVSDCGEPQCAQSYYEELSFSLNNLEDVSLGCTSGIEVFFLLFWVKINSFLNFYFFFFLDPIYLPCYTIGRGFTRYIHQLFGGGWVWRYPTLFLFPLLFYLHY